MTIIPVRLQLSRKKGFRLQDVSLATNGLPGVKITRPCRHGNPFRIRESVDLAQLRRWGWTFSEKGKREVCASQKIAATRFAVAVFWQQDDHDRIRDELGGKNLFCACDLDDPCHGDPLLWLANSTREQVDALSKKLDDILMSPNPIWSDPLMEMRLQ